MANNEPNNQSTNEVILESGGLFKSYHIGATRLEVLKGVDFAVKAGEFVAVVGASGSGKSTLLHILGGLDRPDKGSVRFRGADLASLSGRELNYFRNKTVGFVFQFYHLLDELNVLENVVLPVMAGVGVLGWLNCRSRAKKRGNELLKSLGLTHRSRHKPFQLSGGERQRVAIARALINQPSLILADEPTGNLDSATGSGILDGLERLNRSGQTIVMVSHDRQVAQRAGRIVRLVDGKVV
jgi:lipoprotein-releasing system ATP-binding protein